MANCEVCVGSNDLKLSGNIHLSGKFILTSSDITSEVSGKGGEESWVGSDNVCMQIRF